MNLLEETLTALVESGHTAAEVRWVGSTDGRYAVDWTAFAAMAAECEYDNGFGAQEIAADLVVVGDGWWLARHEYDGSEHWEHLTLPMQKGDARPFVLVNVTSSGRLSGGPDEERRSD